MHCKNCDYPLWNLKTRVCPECGTPFLPSEFPFVRNSVQFCCPHCDQVYYGTGEDGRLVPAEFDCVSCGAHLQMDEMVLRPAEGVDERHTKVVRMPWLERKERGAIKAWAVTVWLSMVKPIPLMRAVPEQIPAGGSWWYAMLTLCLFCFCGISAPLLGFALVLALGGDPQSVEIAIVGAVSLPVLIGSLALFLALWGLVTHGLLRITGGCEHTVRRTYQALCYSTGTTAVIAVPCLGVYCGNWIGGIWWMVSAILMVTEGQRVHGGRATFAVLTFPCALIILGFVAYAVFISVMFSTASAAAMAAAGGGNPMSAAQMLSGELTIYAADHGGCGPRHAVQLVPANSLGASSFITMDTATVEDDIVFDDGGTLEELQWLPPNRQKLRADEIADALPENVIAHRLGDFVFTYHGIDFDNADGGLWIVVSCPDPDVNGQWAVPMIVAGCLDGSARQVSIPTLNSALQQQNVLRSSCGLPPLPDPSTVTHGKPAVEE